ncbi:MAG: hypothetical protein R3Y24_02810 [Eubacteriales bacterium]
MSRLDKFLAELQQQELLIMFEQGKHIINLINTDLESLVEELTATLQSLIDKASYLQKENKKNKICFISFSILLSSIIQDEYSYGINLYDENFLVDDNEVFLEWNIKKIFRDLKQDLVQSKKILQKKFIKIKDYELIEIKHKYIVNNYAIFQEFLVFLIPLTLEKVDISQLTCSNEILFTSGLYMDKQAEFYKWEI